MDQPIEIEIDCAPFTPRPNEILREVLSGTAMTIDDFDIVAKFFGEWTFRVHEDKKNLYTSIKDLVGTRLTQAYHCGRIRYAMWSRD